MKSKFSHADLCLGVLVTKSVMYKKQRRNEEKLRMKLTQSEFKTADLVWEHEPLASGDLVQLCNQHFSWKKSTTYTVLKKLCKAGILKNENAIITSLISREKYEQLQGEQFIEDTFGGSLPKFLTAFMDGKKLNEKQVNEIISIIEQSGEE